MRYISTRGTAPTVSFDEVLLVGLARDGGLYVPESWPEFSEAEIATWKEFSYTKLALEVMFPFVSDALSRNELKGIIDDAYGQFETDKIVPIVNIENEEWLMELFHGPTLAFKDIAMQFLGSLFDHVLAKRSQTICIVGATSGDTGSAAIAALRNRKNINAFILYPHGRISDVQRRQMTTVIADNISTIALEGTFDDCQDAVKSLFNDLEFRDKHKLSAVNSINWARIMAQVVYYFWAALKVGGPRQRVNFAVPTGNFGNVFAGYVAKRMGLPVKQFIVGSNSNDILTRFFETGRMEIMDVQPTISPSMDIQISSNFERLLFEVYNRDGPRVADTLHNFRKTGILAVPMNILEKVRELFNGACFDDDETRSIINKTFIEKGILLDPHTSVGLAAARECRLGISEPMLVLATAHPAKFPEAVMRASGSRPTLPKHLEDLMLREEHINILVNDVELIKDFIEKRTLE
ncbi:MAG: threonine synthase [Magnetovibrio sp.]|nr:threonine synthase [Magnetovibrio sp.]